MTTDEPSILEHPLPWKNYDPDNADALRRAVSVACESPGPCVVNAENFFTESPRLKDGVEHGA